MVTVEVTRWPTPTRGPAGRIIEVLGDINDPGVDTEIILRKHGIPDEHGAEAIAEAQAHRRRRQGEGHRRPHRLPRSHGRDHRRRARARLRRCDFDREAEERPLLARRAHRRRRALRAGGRRARSGSVRARHLGLFPGARRPHVPVGAGDRAVQPEPARRSPGAVVPDGSDVARRRRPLRDARRRHPQRRAHDLHRGQRHPHGPGPGDDRASTASWCRCSS